MAQKTLTTFKLEDQLFGIDVMYVREVNKQLDMAPVPHAPQYIRGLVNLRGQIVTVMDIIRRFTLHQTKITENTCNLILKTDTELTPIRQRENRDDLVSITDSVGLLVDEIDEIITVDEKEIDPPPMNIDESEREYMSGVVQLEKELLIILSVKKILQHS